MRPVPPVNGEDTGGGCGTGGGLILCSQAVTTLQCHLPTGRRAPRDVSSAKGRLASILELRGTTRGTMLACTCLPSFCVFSSANLATVFLLFIPFFGAVLHLCAGDQSSRGLSSVAAPQTSASRWRL